MTFAFLGTFVHISYQSCSVCCRLGNLNKSYIVTSNSIIAILSVYLYQGFWSRINKWVLDEVFLYRSPFTPPPPHRLLIFLTQGNWTPSKFSLLHNLVELSLPREDYHLSLTTLEGYHPLQRIITSHSLPWGIVTPSSLQPLPWWITNPDTKWPVVPF